MDPWVATTSTDPRARALADRHYSRQTPGSRRFVQSGRHLVLIIPGQRREQPLNTMAEIKVADAVWVTHWPIAEYVRHAWSGPYCEECRGREPHEPRHETPGNWMNQMFRNEQSDWLASDLIKRALISTVEIWGEPPEGGIITMIDPAQVRRSRTIGYTYLRAGFQRVGRTKSKPYKEVFQMTGADIMALAELPMDA